MSTFNPITLRRGAASLPILVSLNLSSCPGPSPGPAGGGGNLGLGGVAGSVGGEKVTGGATGGASSNGAGSGGVVTMAPADATCFRSITADGLDQARREYLAGSSRVQLGMDGCARFERTNAGGVTDGTVVISGIPRFTLTGTAQTANGAFDADGDGKVEHAFELTADDLANFSRVDTYFAADGASVVRRTVVYPNDEQGGEYWVDLAEPDAMDQLTMIASQPADFEQSDTSCDGPSGPFGDCTPSQEATLRARLKHGLDTATTCMSHYLAREENVAIMFDYMFRTIRFQCGNLSPCTVAKLDPKSYSDKDSDIVIYVQTGPGHSRNGADQYPDGFFSTSEYEQASTLWHELAHASLGPHRPWDRSRDNQEGIPDFDKVRACENLCFGSASIDKCTCATCLGTHVCDERCNTLPDCDDPDIYRCPCTSGRNAGRVFRDCDNCLTVCPSGLSCFTSQRCEPVGGSSLRCPGTPRATCP